MAEYSVVGRNVTRVDALEKVTGKAKFCSDIQLPGMLYGKVLRSPYAHASIISMDTSKAEKLPGVRGLITGRDVPEKRFGAVRYAFDQHLLARDEVIFAGEGVMVGEYENAAYRAAKDASEVYGGEWNIKQSTHLEMLQWRARNRGTKIATEDDNISVKNNFYGKVRA